MSLLTLTTLPHLFAVSYTLDDKYYTSLVVGTTASSILYHTSPSSKILYGTDQLLTLLWFLYEARLSLRKRCYNHVAAGYATIFLLYICAEISPSYTIFHSICHLISAMRAFHTAKLLYGCDYSIQY
jgi:hypothetical protein